MGKTISPDDVLAQILGDKEDLLLEDNIQKTQERRKTNEIPEIFTTKKDELKKPTKDLLKKWYGHINRLIVDIYIIETDMEPSCGRCENWKAHPYERKWLYKIHELLGLEEEKVKPHIYPCDWNALRVREDSEVMKPMEAFATEMTREGENYFIAYGNGIGYYPAVILYVDSTELKKRLKGTESEKKSKTRGKKTNLHFNNTMEDYEAIPFSGIQGKIKKRMKFKIGNVIYEEDVEVPDSSLLKYILRYLRTLDIKDVPLADNVSSLLGQYHRHTKDK